ncbi:class I SAM-dependent methyltransferase [Labrys sp. KNU-23]|nr:class I SAM-dependent methyltransferase [Labrys sp. KNU-23]
MPSGANGRGAGHLADQVVSLYEAHADAWDEMRRRHFLEAAWLDRFLALLPAGEASILDIGCGAGEPIARHCIERGHRVTGLDAAPSLVELCKARFPGHDWLVGDMRTLALGRTFDGLIAWNSFFHLPPEDQRVMFPIFRRHANPKAALIFTSGTGHGEAIGTFQGSPLYHGSLNSRDYRRLLETNGFDIVSHMVEDRDCGGSTIWFAQLA